MRRLNVLLTRLRGLLGREAVIRDIEEELRFHVEMETQTNVEKGMAPREALLTARRRFGNAGSIRDASYEIRGGGMLEGLLRDARYGARSLLKNPGFTAVAVLTLALGIGATTAIFGVVDAVLLRPLPYPEAERLVKLYGHSETGGNYAVSPADLLEHYAQMNSFERLAAYRESSFNLTGQESPERVSGAVVSPDFFAVMGINAQLGRAIIPGQDVPGGARVVVLSRALWSRRFGEDPSLIGKTVELDGEPRIVIGIMPEGFQYPGGAQLWASSRFGVPEHPLKPNDDPSTLRDTHYFEVVGRLKQGVNAEQARMEADALAHRLKQQYGDEESASGATVVSLHEDVVGETRPALLLLVGAVGILLLIACANVANILLARGATRQKEIMLRMALGASRVRLVRQLLTESVLLAFAGGGLGILLALWGLAPLGALIPPDMANGGAPLKLDARVLIFTAIVALGSAIIFGLFPALNLADQDLNGVLKEGGRASASGARSNRARRLLVVSEIALAAMLLTGAGLLIRSFGRLLDVPVGFNPESVLSAQLTLPQARYPNKGDRALFVSQVIERLNGSTGVVSAAVISRLPLNPGASTRSVEVQGRTPPPSGDIDPDYLVTSPNYFRSMGIPLLKGRDFNERDDSKSQSVVIINEATARYFWPGQDPVGRMIKVDEDWSEVVGVIGNVRQHSLAQTPPPAIYVPYAQDPWPFMTFVVRTKSDPLGAAPALLTSINSVDKDEPVYAVRTMNDVLATSLSVRRWRMLLLSLFAVAALTLACLGIYGVTAYSVTQRTHEIGIRMALGAQKRDVLKLVVLQGVKLALVGVGVGLLGALALMRFATSFLYGVEVADPMTLVAVPATLVGVTLVACCIPAIRATRIAPIIALKYE